MSQCPTCKGTGEIDIANHKWYRFAHGTVPKYLFYQHPASGWKDFGEAREALLDELVPADEYYSLKGRMTKRIQTTRKRSSKWMMALSMKMQDWFMQNGFEFPDSEDYFKWIESAPPPNSEYPPLLKLKESYKKEQKETHPWRQ